MKESNLLIGTVLPTWTCTFGAFNVEYPVQATISTTHSVIVRRLTIAYHALALLNKKIEISGLSAGISTPKRTKNKEIISCLQQFKTV